MSDSPSNIDTNHLENENLPPPAGKVGGVRHAQPTRPVTASISHHNHANHIPSPKTNVVSGWSPNDKDSTAIDPGHTHNDKIALKDAMELPKAVASTYHPDEPKNGVKQEQHTKGHINTRGTQKHIQQFNGHRGS